MEKKWKKNKKDKIPAGGMAAQLRIWVDYLTRSPNNFITSQ